ncbi:hypothetical protein GmHk_12G034829 [Glycine max]|nr:hypothetical protein GmHk_12G034829 [Glycine max]
MHDSIMFEEVDMNVENEKDVGVKVEHIDCSDAFNTSQKLSFSIQGLCEAKVTIIEEMETISKRFEELDVCGKVHLKEKFHEITYIDLNSMCPPSENVKTKSAPKKSLTKQQKSTKHDLPYWEYDSIEYIIDVKADGNCGYHGIVALWGMGEES